MAYLNTAMLIGNLGRDPEAKTIPTGTVTSFSMATTKTWTKDGEKKEQTTWHNISCFGKTAEIAAKYLKKGSQVFVSGEMRADTWEDDSGVKKYKNYIVADKIEFLSTKNSDNQQPLVEHKVEAKVVPKAAPKKVKNFAPGAVNEDDEFNF